MQFLKQLSELALPKGGGARVLELAVPDLYVSPGFLCVCVQPTENTLAATRECDSSAGGIRPGEPAGSDPTASGDFRSPAYPGVGRFQSKLSGPVYLEIVARRYAVDHI